MNIFYLDQSPIRAAQVQCDQHVNKMILESAQLLSTAHRLLDGKLIMVDVYDLEGNQVFKKNGEPLKKKHWLLTDERELLLYKATHRNHPSAIWARSSRSHYRWLYDHMIALGREHTRRHGRVHLTIQKHSETLREPPRGISSADFVEPPQCMPDDCKRPSAIEGYQVYYQRKADDWANAGRPMRYTEV